MNDFNSILKLFETISPVQITYNEIRDEYIARIPNFDIKDGVCVRYLTGHGGTVTNAIYELYYEMLKYDKYVLSPSSGEDKEYTFCPKGTFVEKR